METNLIEEIEEKLEDTVKDLSNAISEKEMEIIKLKTIRDAILKEMESPQVKSEKMSYYMRKKLEAQATQKAPKKAGKGRAKGKKKGPQ